jgi:flagellar biosynthesis/type III secretory pathway M-ring protein FliF/YscJ
MLLVGFLAVLYAGQNAMQPVSAFIEGPPGPAVTQLEARGIEATITNGVVHVPAHQLEPAIAVLVDNSMLTSDVYGALDSVQASPWMSNAQNEAQRQKMMMRFMSGVISSFDDVRSAEVVFKVPDITGFGQSYRKPTAAVTIAMKGGQNIPKHLQEAVVDFVKGGVDNLDRSDVSVIDKVNGRTFTVNDRGDMLPTDVLELIDAVERQHKNKLLDVFSYIPGVRVAVNVTLDPTRQEHVESIRYLDSQPLASQEDVETLNENYNGAGNAGVRPNTEMSITTGSGPGSTQSTVESRTEYMEMLPQSKSVKQLAGHMAERINATINVPRSYFVAIFKAQQPDAEGAPDDTALQPIIDRELADIQEQAGPLVMARVGGQDVPGNVVANMVFDAAFLQSIAPPPAAAGFSAFADSPWVGTASIAGLALAAVALMLMLVRKATQDEPLPTIEELAGVPDVLPADEDLIGEAQDVESTMEGLEIGEEQLKSRKIAEQISDLIKANPGEAGSLLGKWVDADDR